MTRFMPLWTQDGSFAASMDRQLIGSLWPTGHCDGMQVTAAGGNTVNVAKGRCAVPLADGSASSLCGSDAVEQHAMPAAPASGLNRIDLIIVRPRGPEFEGSATSDWIIDHVAGAEAATAVLPATPAGTLSLAQIRRTGGSAAIAAGDITDVRPATLAVPPFLAWSAPRGYVSDYKMQPAADITGTGAISGPALNVPVVARRRYRITMTGRGSTSAAGGCSIRVNGPGAPVGPWSNYQMVVERNNAAAEGLSATGVTFYDATADGTQAFNLGWYGAGTLKILGGSCSALAEDIGGY